MALRSGLQGASLGFSDELRGAAQALGAILPGGQSPADAYTSGRNAERAALEQFKSEHPALAGGSELVGGLALPVGATVRGATAAAKVGRGALAGGLSAGGHAMGVGEGSVAERAGGAIAPTAFGALGGAALGGFAAAIPKAARWAGLTTKASRNKAADFAIADALTRTGQTSDDVMIRAAEFAYKGKKPLFVEVLGPAGLDVLDNLGPLPAKTAGEVFKLGHRMVDDRGEVSALGKALIRASQRRPQQFEQLDVPSPFMLAGGAAQRVVRISRNRGWQKESEEVMRRLIRPLPLPPRPPMPGSPLGTTVTPLTPKGGTPTQANPSRRSADWLERRNKILGLVVPGQPSEPPLRLMAEHLANPENADANLELLLQLSLARRKP